MKKKLNPLRAGCISTAFFIALGIFGFVMLLRGCLSAHDQRFKISRAIIFDNVNGQNIVLSLVENRRTTSYSSGRGITRTSYRTTLWLQTNDLATGDMVQKKKVINISRIKNYPVELWGAANGLAWGFINEVKAYDPATLDEKVNLSVLEGSNPELKGKFPKEYNYYKPQLENNCVFITANDGTIYRLDTKTLKAVRSDEDGESDPFRLKTEALEAQLDSVNSKIDSIYPRQRRLVIRYNEKKIGNREYSRGMDDLGRMRDTLYSLRDSIYKMKSDLSSEESNWRSYFSELQNMKDLSSFGISYVTRTTDSVNGKFYGLLSNSKRKELDDYFRIGTNYDEADRNSLYTGEFSKEIPYHGYMKVDLASLHKTGNNDFLNGGFLLDFKTARSLRMKDPDGFIIFHRDVIGAEAALQISRIDLQGKVIWGTGTGLPVDLQEVVQSGKYLVLFGVTNSNLSSGNANSMVILNLETGDIKAYDYMKRKKSNT